MQSFLRNTSLVSVSLLALLVGCNVDTGQLFGGGGGADGTAGNPPVGGSPPAGGAPVGGGDGAGPVGGANTGGEGQGGAPATCGNGSVDVEEECDGNDLGGQSCAMLGYLDPNGMACSAFCKLDSSGCTAECGNSAAEPGEACDDGNEQPNDGCSTSCTVEVGNCAAPIPIALAVGGMVVSGSTGGVSAMAPVNAQNCMGAAGPEIVYQVTPAASGYLTAYIPSGPADFDSVLYAQTGCAPALQRLCHDNFGTPSNDGGELLSFVVEGGVPVIIVVDGYAAADSGGFDLHLDLSGGAACDDAVPLTLEGDAPFTLLGTTMIGATNAASNALCGFAGGGPNIVYEVTALPGDNYAFDLVSSYNSVTHARTACGDIDTQISCDSPPGNSSGITIDLDSNSVTYLFADGTSGSSGSYVLAIQH